MVEIRVWRRTCDISVISMSDGVGSLRFDEGLHDLKIQSLV